MDTLLIIVGIIINLIVLRIILNIKKHYKDEHHLDKIKKNMIAPTIHPLRFVLVALVLLSIAYLFYKYNHVQRNNAKFTIFVSCVLFILTYLIEFLGWI